MLMDWKPIDSMKFQLEYAQDFLNKSIIRL